MPLALHGRRSFLSVFITMPAVWPLDDYGYGWWMANYRNTNVCHGYYIIIISYCFVRMLSPLATQHPNHDVKMTCHVAVVNVLFRDATYVL